MWTSRQFLCEMVNCFFIYDLNLKDQMSNIEHTYDSNSSISKIFLDITHKCNLKCKHCFTNSGSENSKPEMDTKQIKSLIDSIKSMGVDRLALGGGEPLVRNDIFEIIDYCNEKGIRLHISSNSLLINEKTIDRLASSGIDSVQISIDSAYAEKHDSLRGYKGLFDHCFNAIKLLQEKRIRVLVSTTITNQNIDELNEIAELMQFNHVKMHRFIRFVPVGRGNENKDSLFVEGDKLLLALKKLYKEFGDYLFDDPQFLYGIPLNEPNISEDIKINPIGCEAGKISLDIIPNGDVVPCNYLGNDPRWVCGNVKEASLEEIIQANTVLKEFRNLNGSDLEGCTLCNFKSKCGKGCRAVTYNLFGSFKEVDPICQNIKSS